MNARQLKTVFLKLGGSLLTEKTRPGVARQEVLLRTCQEIANVLQQGPPYRFILGHGSGSFGHVPAQKFGTIHGVAGPEAWKGFYEVWHQAALLNRLVVDALISQGLPAIVFPPSAAILTENRVIKQWNLDPIHSALAANLIPVVYGDVVFDLQRGGTILSTEDLFVHLAHHLEPDLILLSGQEPGVWADYPHCTRLIAEISPRELQEIREGIAGAEGTDVTGGMADKVAQMALLVEEHPEIEVGIFSGLKEGAIQQALSGGPIGTRIRQTGGKA